MKRVMLGLIGAYRKRVSPLLRQRCRYEPSCSGYATQAIERFGVIRGATLAAWRVVRCNPFSHGGFDPVPERFTLRTGPVDPAVWHGERPA